MQKINIILIIFGSVLATMLGIYFYQQQQNQQDQANAALFSTCKTFWMKFANDILKSKADQASLVNQLISNDVIQTDRQNVEADLATGRTLNCDPVVDKMKQDPELVGKLTVVQSLLNNTQ